MLKYVFLRFDKNIKKWKNFIAFFFNSKLYVFMATVKEFKKTWCVLFISKHTQNIINITLIYETLFVCQILATISFRDSPWTDWQGENLREITLIPRQHDRTSYHWKCNGYHWKFNKTRKLPLLLTCCISSQKLNEYLPQCSFDITGSRSSVRNLAIL